MTTQTFNVPNIHCGHCVHTVQSELSELAGVQSVRADLANTQVTVSYEEPATEQAIRDLLQEINYPAVG